MKIPSLDGPKVESRPVGTPYANTNFDTGQGEVTKGLNTLSEGVDKIGDAYQREKQKADATAITDTETELQRRYTNRLIGDSSRPDAQPGFLSLQGKSAVEASATLQEQLQRDRDELSDGLADDNQRKLFRARSATLEEATRRQVETHVSQQVKAAQVDAVKNRTEEAVRAAAADPLNEDLARVSLYSIEGPARALQTSPEDGDATVRLQKGKIADARVGALLNQGNFGAAELLLKQSKEIDPDKAKEYQHRITDLKAAQEGETQAQTLVNGATDAIGRVDREKVIAGLDKLPPGKSKDQARARAEERMLDAHKSVEAKGDDYYRRALTTYIETKKLSSVDPEVSSYLSANFPVEWHKLLKMEADDAIARAQAQRSSERVPPRTAAQAEALVAAKADLLEHPEKYRDPSYTPGSLAREWAHTLYLSDFVALGGMYAEARKPPKVGADIFEGAVKSEVETNPALMHNKGAAAQFRALMGDYRRAYKDNNNGKEPDLETVNKFRANAWTTPEAKSWQKFLGITPKPQLVPRPPGGATPPPPPDIKTERRKVTNPTSPNFGKTAIYEIKPDGSRGRFLEWEK